MDAFLEWNTDFLLTPSGSIQTAVGWDAVRQRIIRRMITNSSEQLPDGTQTPPDYIFDPAFGIGLGKLVDQGFDEESLGVLERRIAQAVLEDAAVDTTIPPSIVFQHINSTTLRITVGLTLLTGESGQISLVAEN